MKKHPMLQYEWQQRGLLPRSSEEKGRKHDEHSLATVLCRWSIKIVGSQPRGAFSWVKLAGLGPLFCVSSAI